MKDIKSDDLTTVFVPLPLSALRSLNGLVRFLNFYNVDIPNLSDLERYFSDVIRQVEGHKPETIDS